MIYVNFILNEKNKVECIGYSNEPTEKIAIQFYFYDTETEEFSTHLLIEQNFDDETNQLIQDSLNNMMEAALFLLQQLDQKQLIQQINSK